MNGGHAIQLKSRRFVLPAFPVNGKSRKRRKKMANDLYIKIAEAINNSQYHVIADGMRNVDDKELVNIIKIIRSKNTETILNRLELLFKYDQGTIELDRYFQQEHCPSYNETHCDCFLPDVEISYCQRQRNERLKNSDYRGTPEYAEWRKAVFERDNYTCQDCLTIGGKLNAHHIHKFSKYPAERYLVENGITLCVQCHRLRHRSQP